MADARVALLDVEGTTTPVEFVSETLFPLAVDRLGGFLASRRTDRRVGALRAALREEWGKEPEAGRRPVRWESPEDDGATVEFVRWLTAEDRKLTPLKELQGLVWEHEYRAGRLVAPVYPDVAPALEAWARRRSPASVFSSGSVLAQRLLFEHTTAGDLTPLLGPLFDTTTGSKREPASYVAIADALTARPEEVLFVSDVGAELDAARAAGMRTVLCVRDGAEPEPAPAGGHRVVRSLEEVTVG
jgi:enolase-phosphatase E1